MKQITKFVAFDDAEFATEALCRAYEATNCHRLLVGLSIEEIERAIAGDQEDVAEALETVGTKIARARRERGDLKRKRSVKDAPIAEPQDHPMVEALRPSEPPAASPFADVEEVAA
jgi:hypothetical protein